MIKELLPEIWKNKSQIVEGIKNLTFKQDHIEELAKHRKSICKSCIWFNQNQRNKSFEEIPEVVKKIKSKEWIKDVTNTDSEKCIHCGCGIGNQSIKLRSGSAACPIGKWMAVVSVEEDKAIREMLK